MKTVLILSGGIDSSTLLYRLIKKELNEVFCMTFNYGQRHGREIESAIEIVKSIDAGIGHQIVDLSNINSVFRGSALTDSVEVPEGHYQSESMKQMVVPNRNMIMLAIAIAKAISLEYDNVSYAAHSGDHEIYPDCRPEFVKLFRELAQMCDWRPIDICTPYINFTKADIVRDGLKLDVPYELTWTCYNGGSVACGKCGSCVGRLEAFQKNEVQDPISYKF